MKNACPGYLRRNQKSRHDGRQAYQPQELINRKHAIPVPNIPSRAQATSQWNPEAAAKAGLNPSCSQPADRP
jgi:hypothetical protein